MAVGGRVGGGLAAVVDVACTRACAREGEAGRRCGGDRT